MHQEASAKGAEEQACPWDARTRKEPMWQRQGEPCAEDSTQQKEPEARSHGTVIVAPLPLLVSRKWKLE
jgi:hypothetical protein